MLRPRVAAWSEVRSGPCSVVGHVSSGGNKVASQMRPRGGWHLKTSFQKDLAVGGAGLPVLGADLSVSGGSAPPSRSSPQ